MPQLQPHAWRAEVRPAPGEVHGNGTQQLTTCHQEVRGGGGGGGGDYGGCVDFYFLVGDGVTCAIFGVPFVLGATWLYCAMDSIVATGLCC